MTDNRTAREIADKISWRDPEALLSGIIVLMWAVGFCFTYLVEPASGSEQAIGQMQGVLNTALAGVVTYWLGSSRGSRRNAERADRALDAAQEAGK
jgi:hypothetical protein